MLTPDSGRPASVTVPETSAKSNLLPKPQPAKARRTRARRLVRVRTHHLPPGPGRDPLVDDDANGLRDRLDRTVGKREVRDGPAGVEAAELVQRVEGNPL